MACVLCTAVIASLRSFQKGGEEIDAFEAGVAAGRKFEPHRKVEAE